MKIIIDYDNDCVRLGQVDAFNVPDSKAIMVFSMPSDLKTVETLVKEMCNMLGDAVYCDMVICKQSDGVITTVEEY